MVFSITFWLSARKQQARQKPFYSRLPLGPLLFLLGASSFAQNRSGSSSEFITPFEENKATVTLAVQQKMEALEKQSTHGPIQYVRMGRLDQLQEDGILSFSIPGTDLDIEARAVHVEYVSETDYTWHGQLPDSLEGHVIVLCEDGNITADIAVGDQHYQIYHLDGERHALWRVNPRTSTEPECNTTGSLDEPGGDENNPAVGPTQAGARAVACAPGRIRVLVLSTPAARAGSQHYPNRQGLDCSVQQRRLPERNHQSGYL